MDWREYNLAIDKDLSTENNHVCHQQQCVNMVYESVYNRKALSISSKCACFKCQSIFKFSDITHWTDAPIGTPNNLINQLGQTALCPNCGFDTVIGSIHGYKMERLVLKNFHDCLFAEAINFEFKPRYVNLKLINKAKADKLAQRKIKPKDANTPDYIVAHEKSFLNSDEIEASDICGCFYCISTFKPEEITIWWDSLEGIPEYLDNAFSQTATCPNCGIDSVIGSASGYLINKEVLTKMKSYWF